jgi:DNA modification methylase
MGIGSTSLACNKIRVNCVGFEIDNNYYETNIQFLKSEITNLDIWKDISSTNQQNITNSITYDKVVKKNSNLQRTRFREKIIID